MLRRCLRTGLALALAAVGVVLPWQPARAADHAVVLQYHHVADDTPASTSTTVELFTAQLAFLADNGFKVAELGRTLDALQAGRGVADSTVCLTFDDAYPSVAATAWPLIRARGWTMTVFVSTGLVDAGLPGVLSWDALRELVAAGVTVGPHGVQHDELARRRSGEDAAARRRRLQDVVASSHRRLVEELGAAAVLPLFAYPYGECDAVLAAVVREAGFSGLGQQSGPVWARGDWSAVPRFPMGGPYGSLDDFGLKVASLPLPVIAAEPSDMLQPAGDDPLTLRLELAPGARHATQVAAYFGGAALATDWQGDVLSVTVPTPLPAGRSRVNVTAPAGDTGRWFWYSHAWLVTEDASP
jgi:peptidoglycan/xylan/chitin deacetylase (PgdA/CDA1 family)